MSSSSSNSRGHVGAIAGLLSIAITLGSRSAKADDVQPPPAVQAVAPPLPTSQSPSDAPLEWRWARFRTGEWVASGVFLGGLIPALFIKPSSHPWTTSNVFDESIRNVLRASSQSTRDAVSTTTDVILGAGVLFPVVVDALIGGWAVGKSRDVAFQMTEIDAEAYLLTGLVSTLTSALTSRERPYGRDCPAPPAAQSADCSSNTRYHSFFSGHASLAFTSAGLTCSHHAYLPLFGGGAPDVIACVGTMAAAATTSTLRIVADRHYASDVLVGAAVGSLSGFMVPWALHYGRPVSAPPRPVSWFVLPTGLGLAAAGQF
jgi:membrane-associated phospholipid phosphatase